MAPMNNALMRPKAGFAVVTPDPDPNPPANTGPTAVSFTNVTGVVAEDADTSSAIHLADIVVTDDGYGTNTLSISGDARFSLVGSALYLVAGASLDYETNTSHSTTVTATDDGGAGSAQATFVLAVQNVPEGSPPDAPTGVSVTVSEFSPPFAPTGVSVAVSEDTDSYFSDTVLLVQDSLSDESALAGTITNNGVTLDTSTPKVGSASLVFDGSSYASIAHDVNQVWGTGDFTIEYWLYADSPSTTNYKVLNKDGSIGRCFVNNFNSSYGAGSLTFALPGNVPSVITVGTVPDATWTYVTISRTNGTLYYGLNGSLTSQANYTYNFASGSNPIEIAKQANYGGTKLVGKIDSLRITKAGRYTNNFTPPTNNFPAT